MEIYHICFSSHREVMFRSREDLIFGMNSFAVANLETDSKALCAAVLSTHLHGASMTGDPRYLTFRTRNFISRHINAKYHRKGRLGEKEAFCLELVGARHIMAGSSYIYRQGVHHGLTDTPFGYEFSSVNSLFKKELGKGFTPGLMSDSRRNRSLPTNVRLPSKYRMSESGLLLPEDVFDVTYMENLYISPRYFLFQMNRKSGEEWVREQIEEAPNSPAVTLEAIEKGVSDNDLATMLKYESGRNSFRSMLDIDLCQLIDTEYVPRFVKFEGATIYDLSESKRADLANLLDADLRKARQNKRSGEISLYVSNEQIRRCAVTQ